MFLSADGTVKVEYCTHHTGHELELCHLRLSQDLRSLIAARLANGVTPERLLDDIRDNVTEINRDMLVTRKEINNIESHYNTRKVQKHNEDITSTDLWILELSESPDNPIIYYKPQHSKHNDLNYEDFLICIQTPFQRDMFKTYASKLVCIDSTYKISDYDFSLTTLLVVDDFHEVIPEGWAVSKREDEKVMKIFMSALRNANGNEDIVADVFMSDLANSFYNAWFQVFSRPIQRLYCSWHVDNAWKGKIIQVLKNSEDRAKVYAFLKLLQMEPRETQFRKMLQEFLAYLQIRHPSVHEYFDSTYIKENTDKMWTTCHRLGTPANTNMFAEAFHRVLKQVYLKSKQNRRIDELIYTLLKIARDKVFEKFIKKCIRKSDTQR